jgi:hypothetical protein
MTEATYMCVHCKEEYDTTTKAAACKAAHELGEAIENATKVDKPETSIPLPLAPELLGRAARHMHDRTSTYDKPEGERSMGRTVRAFNAITGHALSESEGWLLLQVLKDVRLFTRSTYHADSAEDCIAYAALKAEAKSQEN